MGLGVNRATVGASGAMALDRGRDNVAPINDRLTCGINYLIRYCIKPLTASPSVFNASCRFLQPSHGLIPTDFNTLATTSPNPLAVPSTNLFCGHSSALAWEIISSPSDGHGQKPSRPEVSAHLWHICKRVARLTTIHHQCGRPILGDRSSEKYGRTSCILIGISAVYTTTCGLARNRVISKNRQ